METKFKIRILTIITTLLILIGCVAPGPESIRTVTIILPSPTQSMMVKNTAEITPTATKIVIPTLAPAQLERMVALLGSETCVLPCYLSITPGHTSLGDLKLLMNQLGASFVGIYEGEGFTNVGFSLWVGDESTLNDTPDPNKAGGDREISQFIFIKIIGNVVQRIEVSIQTTRFISKYKQYWSRYSLRQVFLQHGMPDILVGKNPKWGTGYGFMIVYEKSGIVALFNGSRDGSLICPEIEKGGIFLDLLLTNPDSGLSIYNSGMALPTNRAEWHPIEEFMGVDTQEFYNQLVVNPDVCFESKFTE